MVVNHSSLLFSHSVEKGTLIFRPTRLAAACELGINCVAEAGAQLQGSRLFSGQVAHNTMPEKEGLLRYPLSCTFNASGQAGGGQAKRES